MSQVCLCLIRLQRLFAGWIFLVHLNHLFSVGRWLLIAVFVQDILSLQERQKGDNFRVCKVEKYLCRIQNGRKIRQKTNR